MYVAEKMTAGHVLDHIDLDSRLERSNVDKSVQTNQLKRLKTNFYVFP